MSVEFNSRGLDPVHHGNDVEVWDRDGEWYWNSCFEGRKAHGPYETQAAAVDAAMKEGPALWPRWPWWRNLRWWWRVRHAMRAQRQADRLQAEEVRRKRGEQALLAKRRIAMHIEEAGGASPRRWR